MTQELPQGWAETKLAEIGHWSSGGTPSRRRPEYFGSGIPWIKSGDLRDGLIIKTEEEITEVGLQNSSAKIVPAGTISMALYGATIGKLGKTTFPAATNQACANVVPYNNLIHPDYLYFFLLSERQRFIDMGQGGAQPNISQAIIRIYPIRLAPIAEQQRIVAKLEVLLGKVDTCRKRLEKIPIILKRFRQSVLAAACSGRLTTDWREENLAEQRESQLLDEIRGRRKKIWKRHRIKRGLSADVIDYHEPAHPSDEFDFDLPESWSRCSMDELTSVITSGSRDWKQYYREGGSGTFIMAQNVRPLKFDKAFRLAVAPPENDRDRARSEAKKDDLLVTIVGANTGDSCRVPYDLKEHYVCQSVALMRPVFAETSRFLEIFLNSAGHGLAEFTKWIYGEGRPHLSFDHLRETAVCLPPLPEQHEIVRRVEALFALADQIETRYAKAKTHVDRLTQSILAKAFRGDLVPQDPNDEPAAVLLERIRSQRHNMGVTSSQQRRTGGVAAGTTGIR